MSGRQSKVCNVEFVCEFGLFISLLSGTLVIHQHWEKKSTRFSCKLCHGRTECIYLLTSINFCDVKYKQPRSFITFSQKSNWTLFSSILIVSRSVLHCISMSQMQWELLRLRAAARYNFITCQLRSYWINIHQCALCSQKILLSTHHRNAPGSVNNTVRLTPEDETLANIYTDAHVWIWLKTSVLVLQNILLNGNNIWDVYASDKWV